MVRLCVLPRLRFCRDRSPPQATTRLVLLARASPHSKGALAAKLGLHLDDLELDALDDKDLAPPGRGEVGEGREAHLRLAGEAGEESEVGASVHEGLGAQLEEQRAARAGGAEADAVRHRDAEVSRSRHRRDLGAALGCESFGQLQILHASPHVHRLVCVGSRCADGPQQADRLGDEEKRDGEGVGYPVDMAPQRAVERPEAVARVEAERRDVGGGEAGEARVRVRHKVVEREAGGSALVHHSVGPPPRQVSGAAVQQVLEALAVVLGAVRLELADDRVESVRKPEVDLPLGGHVEILEHAEGRVDRAAADELVDLELVLAFVVPLLAHERADDLSDSRLQGKQPATG
mmetsp:Transcript_26650/g.79544  ORF Transcript_26650/g.79544 Transcript_26650/m.79544 type:complete len:348 (+) Transcript_26650:125-1168(+)